MRSSSRPARPSRSARPWLVRGLALALSVVLGLFLAEGILFLAGFPARIHEQLTNPPDIRMWVEQLEYQYQWNTNHEGLRYADLPRRKPAGTFRVFVAGDSFVEGEGVADDERFTDRLERRFSADGDVVQFVNGGLGGQSVLQYARIFYWIGLDYDPDALLLAVNVNDVSETEPGTTVDRIYDVEKLPSTRAGRLFRAVCPRLWARLREAREALGDNPRASWDEGPFDVPAMRAEARRHGIPEARIREWERRLPAEWVDAASRTRLPHYLLTWGLFRPEFHRTAIDIEGPRSEQRWEAEARLLTETVRIARERGVEVGLVFFPNLYLYDPRIRDASSRFPFSYLGGVTREGWLTETTEIQRRLALWAKEQSVPFLDLTDDFRRAAAEGAHLQYDIDGHWNEEGQRLVAQGVGDWIATGRVFEGLPRPQRPERAAGSR